MAFLSVWPTGVISQHVPDYRPVCPWRFPRVGFPLLGRGAARSEVWHLRVFGHARHSLAGWVGAPADHAPSPEQEGM